MITAKMTIEKRQEGNGKNENFIDCSGMYSNCVCSFVSASDNAKNV